MTKFFSVLFCCFLPVTVVFAADKAPEKAAVSVAGPVAPPAGIKPAAEQKMLRIIAEQGHDLQFDFIGRKNDLTMWMVSGPGAWQMVYLRDGHDDEAIVGGTLIDEKGVDQSIALQQKFVADHPERSAQLMQQREQQVKTAEQIAKQDIWTRLQQPGALKFGAKDKPLVIVFLDPYQADSRAVWEQLQQKLRNNEISVQMRAVTWTEEKNITALGYVLGDKDAQRAWQAAIDGQAPSGIENADAKAGMLLLKNNIDLLQTMHLASTPLLFYRAETDQGAKTRLVRGMPKDWTALWTEMQKPAAKTEASATDKK